MGVFGEERSGRKGAGRRRAASTISLIKGCELVGQERKQQRAEAEEKAGEEGGERGVSGMIDDFATLVQSLVNLKIAGNKQFNQLVYNSACNSLGTIKGFRIVLVVLTKDTVPVQNNGQISECPVNPFENQKATKGFTSVEIHLPTVGNTTVRFWSVHFPFNSTDYAVGIKTMLTKLENFTATEHEVLLGDVNKYSNLG